MPVYMGRRRLSMISLAVIGGTGFETAFTSTVQETVKTEYGTVTLSCSKFDDYQLYFLTRHLDGHKVPPHQINYRANISALKSLGVAGIIGTAAVGSLNSSYRPGEYAILSDFLDLSKGPVVTFHDHDVSHTDFSEPYDNRLRTSILKTAPPHVKATIHESAVYVSVSGPRYETPAEVRLFGSWGGDVVGMTNAPEAILCREASIPYAGLAIITNFGCGLAVNSSEISHRDVEKAMTAAACDLKTWIPDALATYVGCL